jgi:NDP-sugar pyrophosphorylase family protein
MRAVILAGGLGTRLRPYTTVIPKPLVPVGDRPVLEHILGSLYRDGFKRIDLCVSHLGELIHLYLSQLELASKMELEFHWEEEPLGTAGALRVIPDLGGTFVAMNGDILTTLSFKDLIDHHLEREAALTIAMRRERVDIDLGVIVTDGDTVVGYREKPTLDYDVSMGVYVYDERALSHLPDGPCQFPELVLRLLDAGERVAAYRTDAEWFDIGTLEEHERAAERFQAAPEQFGV